MKFVRWKRCVVAGLLGSVAWTSAGVQAQALKEGDKAPPFSAVSSLGKPLALKDFPGKSVVLFFYIAAFTNA
jgi:cytochrome oxidase Cu insertion factor (SCO1/SenC/PrrC family)